MRALWLIPAVLLALVSADAGANGATVQAHGYARSGGGTAMHSYPMNSGMRHNGGSGIGGMNQTNRWRGSLNHYPRTRYVYALPYGQAGYVTDDYAQSDYDGPQYAQADDSGAMDDAPYAAVAAPPAPAAPAPPAQTVQYTTSGQPPATVAPGARVTKGTLYKYTHNGINTYTNVPPPSSVGAKTLFSYTEVDTPTAGRNLYRCVDGKSQHVNYASAPDPSLYCKSIGYGASAAN
jgi:hypothetical protein